MKHCFRYKTSLTLDHFFFFPFLYVLLSVFAVCTGHLFEVLMLAVNLFCLRINCMWVEQCELLFLWQCELLWVNATLSTNCEVKEAWLWAAWYKTATLCLNSLWELLLLDADRCFMLPITEKLCFAILRFSHEKMKYLLHFVIIIKLLKHKWQLKTMCLCIDRICITCLATQ